MKKEHVEKAELIVLYNEALTVAESKEKLSCHINQIKDKITEMGKENYNLTPLDSEWIKYFLSMNK